MKAYEIYLSGVGEVEITLCDPRMVEDFLNKNYEPYLKDYDLDLDELKEFEDDKNVLLQMVPTLKVNNKDCFFSSTKEYSNFIKNHPEIEIVETYEGYLY